MRSSVFTPIISADALRKMTIINDSNCLTLEDNVLIEWICALQCINHPQCQLKKILPVVFGSRSTGDIGNLFAEGIIDRLPHVIPTACMNVAGRLLASQNIDVTGEIASLNVNQVVKQLLKYLSFLAWHAIGHHEGGSSSSSEQQWHVAAVAAGVIVCEVEECVTTATQLQGRSPGVMAIIYPDSVGHIVASSIAELGATVNGDGNGGDTKGESMPLIKLINFIRESYGIAATNFQDVLYEAAENLSEEESKGLLATLHSTREKALYIARCARL